MIKPSTHHKLVIDEIIVAEGSAKKMQQLRKKLGGTVYLSPNSKIGDKIS